jgi:NAD(P)H-hydrate epimerase
MSGRDVWGVASVPLLTVVEATAVDRAARERQGVPERVLMENAGRSAAQVLARLFPDGPVVAAVGAGNNGGDALVLLRTLASWGREVAYVQAGTRPPDAALLHGHRVDALPAEDAAAAFRRAAVLVDGILGTGSRGAPRAPAAQVIEALNESGRPVVALDLPSGVDATTGEVPGIAVRASVTVSFGWPKTGLLLQPARAHCGRLVVVEIGFPPYGPERPGAELITPGWAEARLRPRAPDAHKTSVGRLLVLAGRAGMAGAAAISARGALRAGAGLVRIASPDANRQILQTLAPEAVFADRGDDAALRAAAEGCEAVLAGPGLGLDDGARRALDTVLEATAGKPVLLDADALTLLAARGGDALARLGGERPTVLTPHPGEMSRLTGRNVAEIRRDPLESARALAGASGCVVLLKGLPSVVGAPGEPVLVNTVGSSDLATAGMGDQLAGVIGALLAVGHDARTAAALGVFYSARAADLAARGRALSPLDVCEHLHRAFATPGARRPPLGLPFVTFDQPPRH